MTVIDAGASSTEVAIDDAVITIASSSITSSSASDSTSWAKTVLVSIARIKPAVLVECNLL